MSKLKYWYDIITIGRIGLCAKCVYKSSISNIYIYIYMSNTYIYIYIYIYIYMSKLKYWYDIITIGRIGLCAKCVYKSSISNIYIYIYIYV